MSRRGLAAIGPVLLFFLPTVEALSPLAASVEPRGPLDLTGVLVVAPPGLANLRAGFPEATRPGNQSVLRGASAEFQLVRAAGGHLEPADDAHPESPLTTVWQATNAVLTWSAILGPPQALVKTGQEFRLEDESGVHCLIRTPALSKPFLFPEDPLQRSSPQEFPPGGGRLDAECQTPALHTEGPLVVHLYGMELWLTSDEEEAPRRIRTGTFQEPILIEGGPTRTVTQILLVRPLSAPVSVGFESPGTVRVHSGGMVGLGQLVVPEASGRMEWGALRREGRLEPFEATGEFAFESVNRTGVRLVGTTLQSPRAATTVPSGLPSAPALLIAGSVALGLAAAAAWALYSKLVRERLLLHPRRALIAEFVQRNPGVEVATIARALGVRWPKASYHLRLMQREGYVRLQRVGGRTAVYPPRSAFQGNEVQTALLRREAARALYDLLAREPGLDQASVAQRTGRSRSQASRMLASLCEAGLVRWRWGSGRRIYEPVPRAA